jgi:hypothetical protein
MPLYYAGARVLAYHPLSAISHGQGLNMTMFSYHDRMCFGLLADRSLVPDLDRLARYLGEELTALLEATAAKQTAQTAGAEQAAPARPRTRRPARRRPAGGSPPQTAG